jgi:hypothetical protein
MGMTDAKQGMVRNEISTNEMDQMQRLVQEALTKLEAGDQQPESNDREDWAKASQDERDGRAWALRQSYATLDTVLTAAREGDMRALGLILDPLPAHNFYSAVCKVAAEARLRAQELKAQRNAAAGA